MAEQRHYDEREVREILRRAIERDRSNSGTLGRSDIVAAASELGIDEVSVSRAMEELERERELTDEMELIRLQRKSKWLSHVSTWAIVNAFLFAVNLLTGGAWWFYWPLMAWGIFVAMHTVRVVLADEQRDRIKAEKRLEKRRALLQKQARKRQKKEAGRELEQTIERGVHALLGAAARRVEAAAEALSPEQKAQQRRRMRIDSDEADDLEAELEAAAEELLSEEEQRERAGR